MTCLVEDITIKITLNHCEGDSTVLGANNDLRNSAIDVVTSALPPWLANRNFKEPYVFDSGGIRITMENTGLYEAPEVSGGDN